MSTCHPPFMVCRRPASVNRKVTSVAVCWSNHTKIRLGKEINRCTVVVANDGGRSFFLIFFSSVVWWKWSLHIDDLRGQNELTVWDFLIVIETLSDRQQSWVTIFFFYEWTIEVSTILKSGQVTSSSPSRTHTHTRILYLLYDLWPGAVLCVFASHAYKFDCIATHR